MSYTILYDKQFVKVADNLFIPMTQIGDNNVYSSNRKRARDWYNTSLISQNKGFFVSRDEVMKTLNTIREDEIKNNPPKDGDTGYTDKSFGYYTGLAIYGSGTRGTTFGMFKGFFTRAMDEAMTVEELVQKNISLTIRLSFYSREKCVELGKEVREPETIRTTPHIMAAIADWTQYYPKQEGFDVYFSFNEYEIERFRNQEKRAKMNLFTKETLFHETDVYFVIKRNEGGYFVKGTGRGYKYSHFYDAGKKFLTEKEAQQFLNRRGDKNTFSVERIELGRKTKINFGLKRVKRQGV